MINGSFIKIVSCSIGIILVFSGCSSDASYQGEVQTFEKNTLLQVESAVQPVKQMDSSPKQNSNINQEDIIDVLQVVEDVVDVISVPAVQKQEVEPVVISEPEPEPEPENTSSYICSSNTYNCPDFSTHDEAQSAYEYCGGVSNDIHKLDRDKDGEACETLSKN
jgi:hypothetical protein